MDNSAGLKSIYRFVRNWSIKASGSYKSQLFGESRDEHLGSGLFDNRQIGFSLGLERIGREWKSLRIGFEPTLVRFYHFESLASQSQFGSEIGSGESTLDFNSYDLVLGADRELTEKTLLNLGLLFSYRDFTDQKIVNDSALFSGEGRKDILGGLSLKVSQSLAGLEVIPGRVLDLFMLDFGFSGLQSNQNDYDVNFAHFNPDYYSYLEYRVSPSFQGILFGKLGWSAAYDFTLRNYSHRTIQDASGDYLTDHTSLSMNSLFLSFKLPLAQNLSIVSRESQRWSFSNMGFERIYVYRYSFQDYSLGLSWNY